MPGEQLELEIPKSFQSQFSPHGLGHAPCMLSFPRREMEVDVHHH